MAFNEIGLDVLREIANIGSSNAATALSSMLGMDISMKVPRCELVPFTSLANLCKNGPETLTAAVLVQMSGDMEGYVMLVQEIDDAASLVSNLLGQKVVITQDVDEIHQQLAPLEEIANIMIGAYLQAISKMTEFAIKPSVPVMNTDMALAIMNVPALVYGEIGEEVLLMETEFDGGQTGGRFLLIPTVESYHSLMKALSIEV